MYSGIACGPAGASGFVNGSVAIQASNATLNSGRKRRSATATASSSSARYASNQALNVVASPTRNSSDSWNARFASVRIAEAFARWSDDSVPHLAAEKPDQAAAIVTIDRSSASPIEISRSWPPVWRPCFA